MAAFLSFWRKKDGEFKHFLLCHVLLHLAMHFSIDLAFSSRRVGFSLCGPCFICKSKDNFPVYLEVVRPELLLQGIWEWEGGIVTCPRVGFVPVKSTGISESLPVS